MAAAKHRRTPTAVLVCGGLAMTLAMGARQGFGLFLQPMSSAHGWAAMPMDLPIDQRPPVRLRAQTV